MAYLTERIGERVLEMFNAEFTNNIKFSWTKEVKIEASGTKEECIIFEYTVKYGYGKEFKIAMFNYSYYKKGIARPYIESTLDIAKIDLDINRLYKMIQN